MQAWAVYAEPGVCVALMVRFGHGTSVDSCLRARTAHPYDPDPGILEVGRRRLSTTRAMAVALATVVGFLGTVPTLGADEAGTFSIIRSYVRDHATLEHAAGTISAGTLEGTVTTQASSGEPFTQGEHSRRGCGPSRSKGCPESC